MILFALTFVASLGYDQPNFETLKQDSERLKQFVAEEMKHQADNKMEEYDWRLKRKKEILPPLNLKKSNQMTTFNQNK